MGQFEVPPVDKPCAFSYVKFSGESENQHENGKFSSENAFCSVLLTLVVFKSYSNSVKMICHR